MLEASARRSPIVADAQFEHATQMLCRMEEATLVPVYAIAGLLSLFIALLSLRHDGFVELSPLLAFAPGWLAAILISAILAAPRLLQSRAVIGSRGWQLVLQHIKPTSSRLRWRWARLMHEHYLSVCPLLWMLAAQLIACDLLPRWTLFVAFALDAPFRGRACVVSCCIVPLWIYVLLFNGVVPVLDFLLFWPLCLTTCSPALLVIGGTSRTWSPAAACLKLSTLLLGVCVVLFLSPSALVQTIPYCYAAAPTAVAALLFAAAATPAILRRELASKLRTRLFVADIPSPWQQVLAHPWMTPAIRRTFVDWRSAMQRHPPFDKMSLTPREQQFGTSIPEPQQIDCGGCL